MVTEGVVPLVVGDDAAGVIVVAADVLVSVSEVADMVTEVVVAEVVVEGMLV